MTNKRKQRQPDNFYKLIRHNKDERKRKGAIEVQGWGVNSQGQIVCAGVHWVPQVSTKWAWKICRNWRRWRVWYDNLPWNKVQTYPAKGDEYRVTYYGIHPIDDPKAIVWASV